MRLPLVVLSLVCLPLMLLAQRPSPVSWSFSAEKTGEHTYELTFQAQIKPGWYIYSQYLEGEMGPIPTTIQFEQSSAFDLLGKTTETGHRKEGYDPVFEMKLVKFSEAPRFVQKVRLKEGTKLIEGYVEFMTCNDQVCLPPREVPFRFEF